MNNLNEFKAESELGSPLTFLDASAGTGKTYTMALEFIKSINNKVPDTQVKRRESYKTRRSCSHHIY